MKTPYPTSVSDHFLSKENFTLKEVSPYGILQTLPPPSPEKIGAYYDTKAYLSHDDNAPGLFASLYRTIKKVNLKHKASLITAYHKKAKTLLDIGCGTGDFLNSVKGRYQTAGVEINPKAAQLARQKDLNIHSDITHLDSTFDVITLWHVLEHLEDPDQVFQTLYRTLEPNGLLIIALPNYKSMDGQYYKSYWAGYDVPRHLWHYDKNSVQKICEAHNLEVVKFLPMYFDAYYVSLLSEQYKKNKFAFVRASIIGTISNVLSLFTGECSSQIYIIRKKAI